jgi:hypothetical protein
MFDNVSSPGEKATIVGEKMCAAGNRVVCDKHGGYIENISSGKKTSLKLERGSSVFDMWVKGHAEGREGARKDRGRRGVVGFVGLADQVL